MPRTLPCPAATLATRDEDGNTYFATWDMPSASLAGEAAPTCLAKISPDFELQTLDPREWTGGREVNNFRYVGNGKAVANVLHHEAFGAASAGELDADTVADLWMSGDHWKLWLFDVVEGTGQPVDGIDVTIGSGAQIAVLDGRAFVFLPYDDWGRTKGYELLEDGTAVERFDTIGDVFKWVRVR